MSICSSSSPFMHGMNSRIQGSPIFLPKVFAFFVLMFGALWIIPPLGPVAFLAIALYALRGPKATVQALMILSVLLVLNPGMYSAVTRWGSLRWLVLAAAVGRMVWDTVVNNATSPQKLLRPIYLFSVVTGILALLVSYAPAISIFKLIAFTAGVSTVTTSFHRTRHLQEFWKSWISTFCLSILLASLPLYFSPLGYYNNGIGFQGIFNQPQVYGPVMAVFASYFAGLMFFKNDKSPVVVIGAALAWLGIFSSVSRTALLMGVAGILLGLIHFKFGPRSDQKQVIKTLSIVALTMVVLSIGVSFTLLGESIVSSTQDFILKQNDTGKSASFETRSSRLEDHLRNFASAPLTGIGFGVASDPERFSNYAVVSTGFLGLPTSAPIEKNFLPSAVIEETGIVGGILTILMFLAIIRPISRSGKPELVCLLAACLIVNVGEAVFFSLGGMGLYFWMLIGYCYNQSESS